MTPYLDDGDVTLYHGDAGAVLAGLPDASVDCVVTSPPYFGLRDYGYPEQIGLEETPAAFLARLVDVFRELRRVLSPTGVCWVNMGDSYATQGGAHGGRGDNQTGVGAKRLHLEGAGDKAARQVPDGYKPKDLIGIPWRLAFALQDDGWWLRSDVIWHKPNPMPESVTDRPTKSHEYLFLLTRAPRYFWDAEGVREPSEPRAGKEHERVRNVGGRGDGYTIGKGGAGFNAAASHRNVRTVWTFATEPNPEAHFATFPRELVRRCLAAGCPERVCATCGNPSERVVERTAMVVRPAPKRAAAQAGDDYDHHRTAVGGTMIEPPRSTTTGWTDCGHDAYRPGIVLDPFVGSGTTAVVARAMGRRCVGIDGSAEYLEIARRRTQQLSLLGGAA